MPAGQNPASPHNDEPPSEILRCLKALYGRIVAWSERFTSGRHWQVKVFLLSVIFSVLFSGGLDYRQLGHATDDAANYAYGYTEGYFQKIENPWVDVGKLFDTGSHDAKLNFRLTVPVALHYLGLRGHWVLPTLTIAAICANLLLACSIAFRLTQDRVVALFVSLGVASTYTGSFGVIAYYDAIALAQLSLAMLPGMKPFFRAVLVFTASFTDERAFVASALLLVPALVLPVDGPTGLRRFLKPGFLAVVVGMAGYVAGRLYLMKCVGLLSPTTAVDFRLVLWQENYLHLGVWFALEGGWLLVALAVVLLWRRREWLALALLFLTMCVLLTGSFMVADVLRSAAYLYPALLVALMIIREMDGGGMMRVYCFLAFVISALGGNYNIASDQIAWQMPLVVKIMDEIAHIAFIYM